jgi:demethylmenaquinone methyltransferase/2-methoxy-6-polyprenyl-1,4-benzoquinol methylase
MFDRIARRYDLLNSLMTFGRDRGWRQRAVSLAGPRPGARILDVGTGTGALALDFARATRETTIVGVDFSAAMLSRALRTVPTELSASRVRFVRGDGMRLPCADSSFDHVVSAFAVRNMSSLAGAFAEQARVLRVGGRLTCLELVPTGLPVFRHLFRQYFHRWVPLLGGWIAGDPTAYTYLPRSVDAFPTPAEVARLLREVGLVDARFEVLALGTVALHTAVKR